MTGWTTPRHLGRVAVILLATTAISGCESTPLGQAISNMMRGGEAGDPQDPPRDENGVLEFQDFRVMVAQDGDTIASMAERAGIPEVVLARYNGLPTTYLLRQGDRLALPDEAQAAAVEQGWTPEVVTGVLDDLPDSPVVNTVVPEPPGNLPLRHRVEPGETLFSIAKLYGVSVTSLASWNGIAGDLIVQTGRSLIIPTDQNTRTVTPEPIEETVEDSAEIETAAVAPATTEAPEPEARAIQSAPGEGTSVEAPPSSVQPLPENPENVEIPEGPDLGGNEDGRSLVAVEKMVTPVEGTVVRPFSATNDINKNDGIDYQTDAGALVRAAASGEVALVRNSSGLGQIVLVRHRDNIITVYGRLSPDVRVSEEEQIRKGQVIGTVAEGNPPIFHFEVRRGTKAIDPTPFM